MQKKLFDDYKNDMENLIERRREVDRGDIDYEELQQNEKKRLETLMGDLLESSGYNQELEELIPQPIQWK